jgi:hypothetical protein
MKKLIFLLIILLNSSEGWGEYEPKFEIVFMHKITSNQNCSKQVHINIAEKWHIYISEYNSLQETNTYIIEAFDLYNLSILVSWDYYNSENNSKAIQLFPCMHEENRINISDCGTYIDYVLDVRPLVTTLEFKNNAGHILTENKYVTIEASNYYSSYPYISDIWEFIIGGEVYSISGFSNTLNMSGSSLIESFKMQNPDKPELTYKEIVDKGSFYVRHIPYISDILYNDCNCDCMAKITDNKIIVIPVLSSPTITSVETIRPTCNGDDDGKAIIHLSRAVYENELLQIVIQNMPLGEGNPLTVPPGASTCTITGLSAGSSSIVLDGKYPYDHSY